MDRTKTNTDANTVQWNQLTKESKTKPGEWISNKLFLSRKNNQTGLPAFNIQTLIHLHFISNSNLMSSLEAL